MSARRAILILICVAAWLTAVGVFGQRHVQATLDARIGEESRRGGLLADTIAAEIGREFARLRSLVKILTRSEQIRATIPFVGYQEPHADEAARLRRQAELQSRDDIIEVNRMLTATAEDLGLRRIQLLHRSGEVIASSQWSRGENDIGSVLSGDRLHAAASIVGTAESFHIDAENVPGYRFAASIEIDNDPIGVLVIEQSSHRIARPMIGHRHRIFVTDEKGVAVITREPELLMAAAADAPVHSISQGERLFRYGQREVTALPFRTMAGSGAETLYRGGDGLRHAAITRPFASEPLWVNVYSPLTGYGELRRSALLRVGLIGLIGLLVMLVIERSVAFALATRAKNAQLRAANLQVEEAMEARSRFFARMSHEIRTPMTGILGMLEQLGLSKLNADQSWLLRTVTNSAESLITIINDILDFTKIEAGRLDLEILDVDVTEVMEQVAQSMASVAAEKGVTLWLAVDPGIREPYRSDPTRLRQVLFNFATNAVKFAEGGRVGLSVEKRETDASGNETIRFSVSDTGIGMDAATVDRLFAPFAQADESTTRRFGGTGLGLSICKALAEMMDGVISVDSAPGKGSTFILDLPLEPVAGAPIVAAPQDFFDGRRIFILGGAPDVAAAVLKNLPGAAEAASAPTADLIIALDDAETSGDDKPFLRLVMAPGHGLPSWLHRNAVAAAAADALGLDPEAFRPRLSDDTASRALMSREEALATGKLVLVADDHPVNREVLRRHIESLGYPVDLVEDGEKAWASLGETAYGILLTDLHMPELDGLGLARRIRADEAEHGRARLPVIAVTASILTGEFEQCKQAGADDVMLKPLLRKDLAVLLNRWVGPPGDAATPTRDDDRSETDNAIMKPDAPVDLDAAIPVDLSVLAELVGDDPGMMQFAFTEYLETTPADLSDLAEAAAAQDFPGMRDCAHRLKGACNMIGGLKAGELAYELEKRSFAGDLDGHDNLPNDVADAVGDVLDFARAWLDNRATSGPEGQ
ncbi:MAG: response regulator [Alphaproteobacteria bacterium]|nr:response regulator [Alphaproteobacteria bacterium]